jgi:hypothetical protein
MTWLTWRQHRKAALFTLLGLAALAALLIPTGLTMHHAYDKDIAACLRGAGLDLLAPRNNNCSDAASVFGERFGVFQIIGGLLMFLPLLVGLFWGAPLVAREIEQGTHRLVWTQGVSRARWAAVKFGLVLGFTLLVGVAYAGLVTWWIQPLAKVNGGRFNFPAFDIAGIAPVAYTMFAVALGVFLGTFGRKVLPAMAVLLAGFLAARILVTTLARPRFLAPKELSYPVLTDSSINETAGYWIQSTALRAADGRVISPNTELHCSAKVPEGGCRPPGVNEAVHNWVQYQPADRYWLFQYIEAGIFVGLAVLLLFIAIRRLRKIA